MTCTISRAAALPGKLCVWLLIVNGLCNTAVADPRPFDVPAGEASTALRDFARQAGLQLLFDYSAVKQVKTRAVSGRLEPEAALTEMLRGTGLQFQKVNDRTVAIRPAGATTSTNAVVVMPNVVLASSAATAAGDQPQYPSASSPASVGPAQRNSGAPDSSGTGSAKPPLLSEVVVTAQKRQERLVDVPASVFALTSDTLQIQHLSSLEDYVASVPGLILNDIGGGYQQLQIRGISSGAAGNATVATYIDNAPVGSSVAAADGELVTQDLDPNDIQAIEVLRGPQGTLYGADNLGGLIKYDTVAPNLHELEGRAWVDGSRASGGGNGYAVRARISLPLISDTLAMLVSGFTRDDPGFISDAALGRTDLNDTHKKGGRVALLWRANDDLSVRVSAMTLDRTIGGDAQEDVDPVTLSPVYGDLQQRRVADTGGVTSRFRLYTATVDWSLGWGNLSSTTSYDTSFFINSQDYSGFLQPAFASLFGTNIGYSIHDDVDQTKFSDEVRLEFATGPDLHWRLGGFYTHETGRVFEFTSTSDPLTGAPIPVTVPGSSLQYPVETAYTTSTFDEYAAFGEATYQVTSRFDITGGLRYARNDQTILQNFAGLLIGGIVDTRSPSSDHDTTFAFTPRLKLSDNMMLYGRIASGYRPGGPNYPTNPPTPPSFGPDRDTNYEIGLKAAIPDQRLSFDLAAFYIDWTSMQTDLVTPTGLNYIGNVGSASSKGVELSITYVPVTSLALGGAFSYTEAKLDSSGPIGADGDPLPYAPRWKGNVHADYDLAPILGWTPFAGASLLFNSGERAGFGFASKRVDLPGYQTFDARAGARVDRWTVQLFAKNLANKHAIVSETGLSPNPTAPITVGIIQPRVIGVSLIAKF
jgi:iron complex outermembrane receptor protein